MDFDVSKVYTAVNADELHKGDLVYGADTLCWLKNVVKRAGKKEPGVITAILTEDNEYRFTVSGESNYQLAYFVCTANNAEAYKAWRYGEAVERQTDEGWEDVDSDELEADSDCWLFQNFRVKQSSTHYRPYKSVKELVSDFKQRFDTHTPAYAMPLVWVKKERGAVKKTKLITAFNERENLVSLDGGEVYDMDGLYKDYTFLDGSPCGVQE